MKKVIIFGLGRFAELVYDYLEQDSSYEVLAFCVDQICLPMDTSWFGKPIFPFEKLEMIYPPMKNIGILFCIGYTSMNKIRGDRIKAAQKMGYQIESYIHPGAHVKKSMLGKGNIIMDGVAVDEGCKVGDGNIFFPYAHISHDASIGNYNFFAVSCVLCGYVKIQNFCFIGANATVRDTVKIEEGTLVGAGAYISSDTEAWGVYSPPRTCKLKQKRSTEIQL